MAQATTVYYQAPRKGSELLMPGRIADVRLVSANPT